MQTNETPESVISAAIRAVWNVKPHVDIITWAEQNIDFSDDVSAERSRLDLSLSPFLVEPLRCWEYSGKIREVTVCAIEQHGKTLIESIGVLYNMIDKPCSMLCVYPSDDDAADINRTKYLPLVRKIPELAAELARPGSSGRDRYIFGASTMFFQGAGKKIMSKSCKVRVLDEEDHYAKVKDIDPGEDTRKRGRSYSESILFRVCTPTDENGPIWKAFLAGSQGYWTLRCKGCGELTMRSCDFSNFQFESRFDEVQGIYVPKRNSIRLICPKCHHQHRENAKRWMNLNGGYVHRFKDRIDLLPSFQFGALASQFPAMDWYTIAAKILSCGKRADISAHKELDNSYKGLPYKEREIATEDLEELKQHFYHGLPPADKVELVFAVSDTQDTFSPTGIFALDCYDNLYLLKYDNLTYLWLNQNEREIIENQTGKKIVTVEDWVNTPVLFPATSDAEDAAPVSILPLFHIVDYRGHRQPEIKAYTAAHRNVFMYAGAMLKGETFRPAQKAPRMLIVDAKTYKRSLIWHLYKQRDKKTSYLYLPDDLDPAYQAEISCVQPDKTRKSGHLYENWSPLHDAIHDAFDVIKMAYFAVDFAVQNFHRTRFRIGKSPALMRRWRAADARAAAPAEQPPSQQKGWFL